MNPIESLKAALARVHSQRMALAEIKDRISGTAKAIAATKNGKLLDELCILKSNTETTLNNTIADTKELARVEAIAMDNKRPVPGVLVKAKTTIEITNQHAALKYVTEHYPTFLSYDERAFKNIMKALPEDALPEFVCIATSEFATPTIVKDLSEFYELTTEEPPF